MSIKRLKELEAKATQGPWFWIRPDEKQSSDIGYYEPYTDGSSGPGSKYAVIERDSGVYPPDVDTCEFIMEMRNNAKKLLAVVEAAEEYFNDDTGEFNPKYFPKRAAVQKALKALHES